MAEVLLGGKRLTELKVTELKAELDKRGLPKKGVKSVLVQRLKNAILKEALTEPEEPESGDEEEADESLLNSSQDEGLSTVQEDTSQNDSLTTSVTESDKLVAKGKQVVSDVEKQDNGHEEVPETMSSDTATATGKDVSLELQETSETHQEATSSVAADQDNQDIDIEGTGESGGQLGDDVPMELTTPLSSGSELNLSFDSELVDEKDKIAASSEVATIKKDDETMDVDVVGEGATTASTTPRTERVDSVQIDPSFKPESEELLYEGDVENDGEENKAAPPDSQPSASAAAGSASAATHEEGFVLAVDDTFADLNDVAPSASGKSAPKKPESSSKPKSEKNLSKSQSTSSSSQSGKAKTEVSSSSSSSSTAATTTTTAASGSKHTTKESGKSTSSDSTEGATSSSPQCNLWVSGLATSVRALDLQTLFSRYGQVLSAKIVAKSRSRPQNRFGYVSMAKPEEAELCIKELNGTELKGRKITVEVARSQPQKSGESITESSSPSAAKETSNKSSSSPASRSPRVSSNKSEETSSKSEKPSSSSKNSTDKSSGDEKPRDLRRSLDSKGAKIQITRKRSNSPTPIHRRLSGRRSRTPPPLRRRSSPLSGRRVRSRSRSPPRYGRVGGAAQSRDAREIIRREIEKRGGQSDPFLRERERQTELRLQERRLAHERQQEMMIRRQLELEHSRREQELARRMQEATTRETRERELRERQLAERDRQFRERERELREKEFRERQRREALEQELRQRETREKEFRDRERKLKEQHEREIREREVKMQREKEMRDRETRAHLERERELRERESRLKEEQDKLEREHRLYQEQQRQLREQAERERQAAMVAKEEADRARQAFEREERERRQREKEEHKHQEEERRTKREREQREKRERDELEKRSGGGWLGKRPHPDTGSSGSVYGSAKRPTLHGNSDSYGTVFSRLDPQTQQKKVESSMPPLMSTHVDTFRRPSDHRSGGHSGGNVYAKAMSGGLGQSVRPAPPTDLSPELLNAATQALENLRKSVHSGLGTQLSLPTNPMPHLNVMSAHAQLQQLAASNASAALSATASGASRIPVSSMVPGMNSRSSLDMHHQTGGMLRQPVLGNQGSGGGGMGVASYPGLHGKGSPHYGTGAGGTSKLPPEEERYNRRFGGRSSHHQSGGRSGYKGRMN